jgi:lipopolysaccharide/colanic/teichoic acid biosynthesis glycosyltransferase
MSGYPLRSSSVRGLSSPLLKRAMDVTLATVLIVLVSPVLLTAALLVRVSGGGGFVLYRQTRMGVGRRPFEMLKFRTMRVDCDDRAHREYVTRMLAGEIEPVRGLYKLPDDDRVTRIGHVLRRWSIDELPQLWNVVRGDMSLVGPRPSLPWEAELFPDWAEPRYDVRPGITGLWQVSGRSRLTMLEGLRLDVAYVSRASFVEDLRILVRTLAAVAHEDAR